MEGGVCLLTNCLTDDLDFMSSVSWTRHVFVKHGCPRRQQSQTMAKISESYILTPHHPQGHVMSVKCEQPLDELTVQVCLLYDHPNFKYCTLFISGTELRTDGLMDRRMDDPSSRGNKNDMSLPKRKGGEWLFWRNVSKWRTWRNIWSHNRKCQTCVSDVLANYHDIDFLSY